MTYAKKTEGFLEPIIQEISNSEPGETVKIGPVQNLGSIRWRIYSWMAQTGLKRFFVLKTKPPYIFVEHRQMEVKVEKISGKSELPKELESFLQALIVNPEKGREALVEAYRRKEITGAEFAEIMAAFDETQR